MRRTLLGIAAALLALLVLAGCGDADAADDGPDGRVQIGMQDNFFTRDVTRVAVGDTVRFVNTGDTVHNAVAVDGSWSTGEALGDTAGSVQEPGTRIDISLDEPGVYEYFCTLHGTAEGGGMAAVLVVGDVEYSAAGEDAPTEPVTEWTGTTRRVPEDHPTIQNAVDAAEPGDLVLVGPAPQDQAHLAPDGRYVWKEQVDVATPYITIRGTDRDEVIVDGEFERPNAINVAGADGVAVENLTVRNATINGVFWTGLEGYRGSHLTAYNNGVYGIYAFDATDGLFEHSYASGSPDAGFYIGQCDPCEAVIRDVLAEGNGLGYSGTNASGVHIYDSVWRDNAAGIVPNSLDSELLPPVRDVVVAGNLVHDNSSTTAPALKIQDSSRGIGIVLGGARDSTLVANRIQDHAAAGVAIVPLPDDNVWFSGGNTVRDNVVEGSGYADVLLTGPGLGGDCLAGNELTRTIPAGLQLLHGCDAAVRLPMGSNTSGLMFLAGRFAQSEQAGPFPINDWRSAPVPPPQESMAPDAPVRPAVGEFAAAERDLDSFSVPAAAGPVHTTSEATMSGMPLAAGFWPGLFSLYGYLLPFVLLAAWTAIALWDLARREDLGRGATIGWTLGVLVVPFVGPLAYHAVGGSPIPGWHRAAFTVGGLLAYVVVLAAAAVTGGLV